MNLNLPTKRATSKIKEYLSTSVLHASRRASLKLYTATKEKIISDILTQEDDGKECHHFWSMSS